MQAFAFSHQIGQELISAPGDSPYKMGYCRTVWQSCGKQFWTLAKLLRPRFSECLRPG